MTELKPCPFCGGRAHNSLHMTDAWRRKDGWHDTKALFYIMCDDCGCRVEYCERMEDAEAAWNRRANDGN